MYMMPVSCSSSIFAVGYDDSAMMLQIRLREGEYAFSNVPLSVWRQFEQSGFSHAFFTTRIQGHYSSWKVS